MKHWTGYSLFILAVLLSSCGLPVTIPFLATATATATLTPTITPTPTPSPTPTPTPTPEPSVRVDLANQALFAGDYDRALQEYQIALNAAPDDPTRMEALIGMGRCQILLGQPSVALTTFTSAISRFPSSPLLAIAYFFMGDAYQSQSNLPKAVDAYAKYVELRPGVLDDYIQALRGDLLFAAADPQGALAAYQLALQAPHQANPIPLQLKIGQMYVASSDYKNAIRQYLAAYDQTSNSYYKAQANLLAGLAYMNMGMPEQAFARYQDSVNNYPQPYDTYTGLVTLVNAGQKVDELQRGLVDYYAGQSGYAIEAFNRYMQQNPDHDGTPHHFKALSLIALNQPEAAIAEWDLLIQNFPRDPYWATAWDEKSATQWLDLGQYREAADTLIEFVKRAPAAPEAPTYLYEAARILERDNRLSDAAPIWERLMMEYPSSSWGWRGLFLAGVTYYRIPDLDAALTTFQRALVLAADPEEQSAADFWVAKTYQAQGKTDQARAYWEQCANRDPSGYYSVRAREVLLGVPPFGEAFDYSLNVDQAAERSLAESWMRITFNLDPATDLAGPGELPSEPRFQRGTAFWELGLYDQARDEFESLREDLMPDAANTFRLIQPLQKMGFYRSAILASRQVLTLAGLDDAATLTAPTYFNHIRFGTFFQDLVLAYSQLENLNPLFMFGVIRQESMFEGFANSGAGARGLLQIMPATGQEISKQINWPPNFTAADLYRPLVSIRLGSRYMARQRDAFDGDLLVALAAYNGGPGNAQIWLDLAGGDPDLFLEIVRIKETRDYITQIYEFTNLYRLIYEKTP